MARLTTSGKISSNAIKRIDPSKSLTPTEKKLWDEIVDSLAPEHFVESDRIVLETFIKAHSYALEAKSKIDEEGSVLIDNKSGRAYKNPWTSILSSQQTVINLLAPKLRLSPSGRLQNTQTRVQYSINPDEIADEDEQEAEISVKKSKKIVRDIIR